MTINSSSESSMAYANQFLYAARKIDSSFAQDVDDLSVDNFKSPDFLARLLQLCQRYDGDATKPVAGLKEMVQRLVNAL